MSAPTVLMLRKLEPEEEDSNFGDDDYDHSRPA